MHGILAQPDGPSFRAAAIAEERARQHRFVVGKTAVGGGEQMVGRPPSRGRSTIDLANSDKDKALEMVVGTKDNSLLIYEIN